MKRKQRLLSLLLTLCMALTMLPGLTAPAHAADSRIPINTVEATSENFIPVFGEPVQRRYITVTVGDPAHFLEVTSPSSNWYKKNEEGAWKPVKSGNFTEGEWCYNTQVRTGGASGKTHVHASPLSVKVNGVPWFPVDPPDVEDTYSFIWVTSPEYTVTAPPPTITAQPQGVSIPDGGTAVFSVTATDAASYHWYMVATNDPNANAYLWGDHGETVTGQATSTLTLSNVPSSLSGKYIFCRIASSQNSSVTTQGASLAVRTGSIPVYTVTVDGGSGGGSFAAGETVAITAQRAPAGTRFKGWTGADSLTFTDGTSKNSPVAKFTMPGNAVSVKSTYESTAVSITSVDVSPATASVQKGTTQQFTAAVSGTGAYTKTVTWEVTGGGAGTGISTSGLLTVAAGEAASALTVKATATGDSTKTDTATVTVTAAPVTTYALTVTNGAGDGNYAANAVINISADAPAAGKRFKNWTASGGGSFGDTNSAATTYTMPAGAATVTANYEDMTVSSISVNSTTHKRAYTVGDSLDVTNLTILVTKSDGSTETVPVTSGMVKGFDSSAAAASRTLTITYLGKTTSYNISIAQTPVFVAVTNITGVPTTATAGTPLALTGTVAPANATNQTIFWDVKDAGTTGASINGSTLSTTAAGTVKLTATIVRGFTASSNYTKDFDILVYAAPLGAHVVTVNDSYAGTTGAGSYAQGATVNIDAGSRSNYSFAGWTVVSGGVTITNAGSKNASFTMPNNAVAVKANWSYNYTIIQNANGTYTVSEGKGYTIICDGSYADYLKTLCDGKEIPAKDLEVKSGSTVITIKPEYLKTLAEGKHTLKVVYNNGAAETTMTVIGGSEWKNPFTDVAKTDWFYGNVGYVYQRGIMAGISATLFAPKQNATRGMLVAMLHRMAGSPAAGKCPFDDVKAGSWYENAVAWAAENKLVSGYGSGKFGPDDILTREQTVTILCSYAKLKGMNVDSTTDLSAFSDGSSVSAYAVPAMKWAVKSGIISGMGADLLSPKTGTDRGQMAAIFHRFMELSAK